MKKKIIFTAATHGNEGFSIPILKKLSREGYDQKFDWVIANPVALKKDKRFIDVDLNRVAPGDKNGSKYEIRRSYELLQKLSSYDYVIDLHGTPAKTGIFTIVTSPKIENVLLAASLPIKNVVIWSLNNLKQSGPLTQFIKCGLEIECGPKESPEIKEQLYTVLRELLESGFELDNNKIRKKVFYRVYEPLMKKDYKNAEVKLNEFEKAIINKEFFFPLLINRYQDIICYKMEKINDFI